MDQQPQLMWVHPNREVDAGIRLCTWYHLPEATQKPEVKLNNGRTDPTYHHVDGRLGERFPPSTQSRSLHKEVI